MTAEDPRVQTIREAREKALNALNAGIPGSLDAFLHWENVADAALDSLAADLEAQDASVDELATELAEERTLHQATLADLEAAREALQATRDWIKFAANSEGGVVAQTLDAALARLSAGKETG